MVLRLHVVVAKDERGKSEGINVRRKHVSIMNAVARGSYVCTCSSNLLYMRDHDTCICKRVAEARSTWTVDWVIILGLSVAATGAYTVYKCSLHVKASMLYPC